MRSWLCCALLICPLTAVAQDESAKGVIVPAEGGLTEFEPEWGPDEFNIGAYFDGLHPDAAVWYQHIQTLANPWLEGRQPGTRGDELAAEYMTWHMNDAGLEPAFGDTLDQDAWRQPFTFSLQNGIEVKKGILAIEEVMMRRGEDFDVLANSGSGTVTAPIAFVGYGIEDGPDGYTSFAETDDLTDHIAVLLRYEPLDDEGRSQWSNNRFSTHSTIRTKMRALRDRGAAAILLVNPIGVRGARVGLESPESSAGFRPMLDIPTLHISADTANDLLSHSHGDTSLEMLQTAADQGVSGVVYGRAEQPVTIETEVSDRVYRTHNVGGIIPGQGELADEWVIIGGHYDHLGKGYTGSRTPRDKRIHPGADDNASGIATMLILADRLARTAAIDTRPRRSALFIGFGGEEAGLHGSQHFVTNPTMDLDDVNFMFNFDMMGRVRGNQVALNGTGTAEEFDEMLPRLVEPSGLTVSATPSGLGPSDHSNFFREGVPVLFFFTGIHNDYHTPEDLAWRVNPEGTLDIIDLSEAILDEVMHDPNRLTWVDSTADTQTRRTGARVRLGIMPSYSTSSTPGVLVDAVIDGTSAHAAGLQQDDLITSWDDQRLEGGRDLMQQLRNHEPGDVVTLTIIRDDDTMQVPVTLRGRGD